jgi:two-component system, NarL family, response regulator LiaR
MEAKIRLLIVDDHPIFRKGLRDFLEISEDIDVVGEAADGREALRLALQVQPDLILLDLIMPVKNGIEVIQELKPRLVETRFLVLSSSLEDEQVLNALKAGAHGYLLKDTSPDQVLAAIRRVNDGETVLHPAVTQKLLQEVRRPTQEQRAEQTLTERELAVIRLLARGLSNQEIARELTITERTVSTHITNILGKLGLENRTQAALYATSSGLV